jgi:hypothetical protein
MAADEVRVGGERTDDRIGLAQFHLDLSGGLVSGFQQVFDGSEGWQAGSGVHGFGAGGVDVGGAEFFGQLAQSHDAAQRLGPAGIERPLRPATGGFAQGGGPRAPLVGAFLDGAVQSPHAE